MKSLPRAGLFTDPIPDQDPAVTSVEVYGFLGWVTSAVAYVLYVLWAFTPDVVLENHAITYYPNKYWAIALPTWICVTILFVYWIYEALNMMATPKSNQLLEEDAEDMNNQYFRVKGDDRLLPLVRLPKAVVHAVLVHGMSPSGMVILIKTFCDVSYPKVLRRGGDLMCITQKQRDGLRKVREKAGHHFEKV